MKRKSFRKRSRNGKRCRIVITLMTSKIRQRHIVVCVPLWRGTILSQPACLICVCVVWQLPILQILTTHVNRFESLAAVLCECKFVAILSNICWHRLTLFTSRLSRFSFRDLLHQVGCLKRLTDLVAFTQQLPDKHRQGAFVALHKSLQSYLKLLSKTPGYKREISLSLRGICCVPTVILSHISSFLSVVNSLQLKLVSRDFKDAMTARTTIQGVSVCLWFQLYISTFGSFRCYLVCVKSQPGLLTSFFFGCTYKYAGADTACCCCCWSHGAAVAKRMRRETTTKDRCQEAKAEEE